MSVIANPFDPVKRAISEAEREWRRAADPASEPTAGGWELATITRDGQAFTVKVWNRQHPYKRFARLLNGTFTDLSDDEWDGLVLAHE